MKISLVLFVFLSLVVLNDCGAQTQGVWIRFGGADVYLPSDYIDPSYSEAMRKSANPDDQEYASYLHDHLFPLPDEVDYEIKIENWLLHNRKYYPQFMPTGNPTLDSLRMHAAQEFWKLKNEKLLLQLSGYNNPTAYSDEEYQALCNSLPKRSGFEQGEVGDLRYQSAVQEWIRIHSMQAYLAIQSVVENHNDYSKTGRE